MHSLSVSSPVSSLPRGPSSLSSPSDEIVRGIQALFVDRNIGWNNYWGVRDAEVAHSHQCVSCKTVITPLDKFVKTGPTEESHAVFCRRHAKDYTDLCRKLETACREEGKDLKALFNQALKTYHAIHTDLRTRLSSLEQSLPVRWVFVGIAVLPKKPHHSSTRTFSNSPFGPRE